MGRTVKCKKCDLYSTPATARDVACPFCHTLYPETERRLKEEKLKEERAREATANELKAEKAKEEKLTIQNQKSSFRFRKDG